MKFHYNPRKATQAVAYLVNLNGGSISLYAMLKLVYLFDRESLIETGSTITGDSLDCLPFGPTPSRIYDNTKEHRDSWGKDAIWREYLTESVNNQIKLQNAAFTTDELSDYERNVIKRTWETHGNKSFKELFELVHKLPEFKDPQGSSFPIEPEDVLRLANWTVEEIELAKREATREKILNSVCK